MKRLDGTLGEERNALNEQRFEWTLKCGIIADERMFAGRNERVNNGMLKMGNVGCQIPEQV